jgi:3D (Asp-Asp-Asp) domain-containing protein
LTGNAYDIHPNKHCSYEREFRGELSLVFGEKSRHIAIVCLLIIVSLLFSRFSNASNEESCSSKWRVTGYFTPVELDYPQAEKIKINIEQLGESVHSAAFLKAVKIEGWGKTKVGWYLGRFSNKWHRSKSPLNAVGKPLNRASIATDKNILPTGSILKIPSLPNNLKHQLYVSDDVGSAIKNTHIDIYTGEGRQAEKTTFEITGQDHTVCRLTAI